jgi:hypothetical protein
MEMKIVCSDCRGTGLYHGFCEPDGVYVICVRCGGTGCCTLRYEPYTGRKKRTGVKEVRQSAGTFIATGVGPTGPSMTYKEFLASVKE